MTQADLFSDPKPSRAITLSEDQAEVLAGMMKWAARPTKLLTVGGLGGTGKSTILGVFAKEMEGRRPAFISFTGRAASVLARKLLECGVKTSSDLGTKEAPADERLPLCTTIHRFLYRPVTNAEEEVTGWKKRTSLPRRTPFVVIDEASMVGDKILKDIQALNVPILAVGDHGQLPPVQDSGSLMEAPMLKLEKIHRQAADNPIIQLAHGVRETGLLDVDRMPARGGADRRVRFAPPAQLTKIIQETHPLDRAIGDVGIICWRNVTRVKLNVQARTALGISGAPRKGEPVVCLRNIHARGIWNGMRGWLTADARPGSEPWLLLIEVAFPEEGITAKLTVLAPQFSREKTYQSVEELIDRGVNVKTMSAAGDLFDFGYAMSCHKFQGSQVKTAIVYVDRPVDPWSTDWRRWMYTAATRASEKLIVIKAGAR